MIWLLSNLWWLGPLVLLAAIALHPASWPILARVPARWWLAAAFVALLGLTFQAGRWYERSAAEKAQDKSENRADAKGEKVAGKAQAKAQEATATTRQEASDAQAEARVIVRTLPADCPEQPARLRELGESAVEATRRSLPATPDR